MSIDKTKRTSRWYFGGLSTAAACCCTHPLDLIKVVLQTQQGNSSFTEVTRKIIREQGIFALYSGLSASVLRQLTYSTVRFGFYELGKPYISTETFSGKVLLSGIAGALGGLVGTPTDMINVRMQYDITLPMEQRRNYKHALDGLWQVYSKEGSRKLFAGGTAATLRGVVMTIGQVAFYNQVKTMLLNTSRFEDDLITHFMAALTAAGVATILTQPLDVLKTRTMNAKPGEYAGLWDVIKSTGRSGPFGFFKGFIPAFIRMGPQTVLTFVFMEQLRQNFGHLPSSTGSESKK